jgi:hypothetical protein
MRKLLTVLLSSVAAIGGVAVIAQSQNPPQSVNTYGQYNSTPLSGLSNKQFVPIQVDSTGVLKVDCFVNCGLTQSSTTSGQSGSLVMGGVTTAAPTYTTAQTNPLSLTTAGDLRAVISNTGFTANAGTNLNTSALALDTTLTTTNTDLGPPGATVCATDTGSCSLNALTQRLAQRLTTINTTLGTPIQSTGGTVTANAGTNLNTSALALESGGNLATLAGGVTASVYQHNTKQVNGVTTLAGAGAVGTGAQRVAVGQDTTTIAGSAPGTAGSASTNVVTVQGITSMTKLLVTPDSVALPANQSVNVAQMNGVATTMGTGNSGTGVQRVVLATDQPALTNKLLVTPDANSAVNVAQVNGVTVTMGNGAAGTGVQRVAVASDNTAFSVNAQPTSATTGGASNYHVIAAASDNHVNIKNGAGTVYDIDCTSTSDGTVTDYVRLYDAGTGFNGCNSATNIIWGMTCPSPVTTAGLGGGFTKVFGSVGRAFSTGLSICITGNGPPSDTGTTNAHTTTVVNVGYK